MSEEFIVTDEMLHAYADGELDLVYCDRMTQYLAQNPDKAAEMASWKDQKRVLSERFSPILDEELPEDLQALFDLSEPVKSSHIQLDWFRGAIAACIILAGGVAVGWIGARLTPPLPQYVVGVDSSKLNAVSAHLVFVADTVRPVEITAERQDFLMGWLSKRLGREFKAPDFSSRGFSLIGGRLLHENNHAAAQLMYENAMGKRITLYVAATSDDVTISSQPNTTFQITDTGDTVSFYWVDDPFGFALTGNIDQTDLLDIAKSAYEQLEL